MSIFLIPLLLVRPWYFLLGVPFNSSRPVLTVWWHSNYSCVKQDLQQTLAWRGMDLQHYTAATDWHQYGEEQTYSNWLTPVWRGTDLQLYTAVTDCTWRVVRARAGSQSWPWRPLASARAHSAWSGRPWDCWLPARSCPQHPGLAAVHVP